MKSLSVIALLGLLFAFSPSHAQKVKTYKARVILTNDTRVKGVLYAANEEGLVLLDKNLLDTVKVIDPVTIEMIKVRKKGRVGNSTLIGAASGMALGAIIGFASGDDPDDCWILCYTAEEKALLTGTVLAVPGAGVGALIGTESKKFRVNGDIDLYQTYLPELRRYALQSY